MCHNAVDGRFHILCKHFVPMNSTFVDCMRVACIYSSQHVHASSGECNRGCIKYMNPPAKNPIRLSQTSCPSCVPPPRVIL